MVFTCSRRKHGGADSVPDKVEEVDEDRRVPAVGAARLEYL